MNIRRLFGIQIPASEKSETLVQRLPLAQVRASLQNTLHDCHDPRTQRTIYKINVARTPSELWLLRSEVYQCISHAHNQSEAVNRINDLVTVFEGWVPARSLTRI